MAYWVSQMSFQHTAARRRLVGKGATACRRYLCFNTQPPEGGWYPAADGRVRVGRGFNTQPPEGGWLKLQFAIGRNYPFQHTAARRRLVFRFLKPNVHVSFQHTAARRRLVFAASRQGQASDVSTHSRPKAAGMTDDILAMRVMVSTHSRPKAAGRPLVCLVAASYQFQHTAARRRLGAVMRPLDGTAAFQHTAARRRLGSRVLLNYATAFVSTHSRPKAAGSKGFEAVKDVAVSTHSRPKAAGLARLPVLYVSSRFQHTAARRRLASLLH